MKLVQLSGIEESEGGIAFEESDLIRFLGERLNCSVYCLHIPAILEIKAMRNMIIGREAVRKVMDMAKDVNFVLMSLTTLAQWKSRLRPNPEEKRPTRKSMPKILVIARL